MLVVVKHHREYNDNKRWSYDRQMQYWSAGAEQYQIIDTETKSTSYSLYDKDGIKGERVYSHMVKTEPDTPDWIFLVQVEVKPRGGKVYHITPAKDIESLK